MHARATKHCNHGLLPWPKEKENYLHGKAPNKQKKNGKSFWVFFLITTKHAGMFWSQFTYRITYLFVLGVWNKLESKLTTNFFVFLKLDKHTRRKREKEIK